MKSLFPNVPSDQTIEIALKIIYRKQEIATDIRRKEIKDLLFCIENIPFTSDTDIYQWRDGVSMESPLGLVLAGITVVKLEKCYIPKLKDRLCF